MQHNRNVHPAEQLAQAMRRIYAKGYTTTSGGNLSLRDKDGSLWITPTAVDKGTLSRADILHVLCDGTVVGKHKVSCDMPFHAAVLKARPDLNCVLHAHSKALAAYSAARKALPLGVLPRIEAEIGRIGTAPYRRPGSKALGQSIEQAFKKGCNVVILQNHGVMVGGQSLKDTLDKLEKLERLARICTTAAQAGAALTLPACAAVHDVQAEIEARPRFAPEEPDARECDARAQVAAWANRAYEMGHCTAFSGCFAVRVSGHSFIINPQRHDRQALLPEDTVLISCGKIEAGKTPDRHVLLAEQVFSQQPETIGFIAADPCGTMAFAVTDMAYQAAASPESYGILEDLQALPYGAWQNDPADTAGRLTPRRPDVLVKNDCLLVTGTSVFNTFDCLEVCEFTAQTLLQAEALGGLMPLTEKERAELDKRTGR